LLGFTIITAELHNRMPVILEPANSETWLSATATTDPQVAPAVVPGAVDDRFPDEQTRRLAEDDDPENKKH